MQNITTNRVRFIFDIDNIKRDYVIIRIGFPGEKKKWRGGAPVLDRLLDEDVDAVSVVYCWGSSAYSLFRRPGLDIDDLLKKFNSNPDFGDVTANVVEPVERYAGEDETTISGLFLARLMLNSLAASRSKFTKFHYSNLSGSLLLVPNFDEGFLNQIGVAKVEMSISDSGTFLLNVSMARYRKIIGVWKERSSADPKRKEQLRRALKKPHYIYHEGRGSLRRCLNSDDSDVDASRVYVECGITGKRMTSNFLHFGSMKDFEQSRAGILSSVIEKIEEELGEYIDLQFLPRDYQKTLDLDHTLMKKDKTIRTFLEGHHLHIVDTVGSPMSAKLATAMQSACAHYVLDSNLLSSGVAEDPGALNFRIIHNAEYYDKEGLPDEYKVSSDGVQRQHLTLEATGGVAPKAMVKTLLKEQLVKFDIANRKLSIFDWSRMKARDRWNFGTAEKDQPIRIMSIDPDGSISFELVETDCLGDGGCFQYVVDMLDAQDLDYLRKSKGLIFEGFVASEQGDVNLIFRTSEICLPELRTVKRYIREKEEPLPEGKRTGVELSSLVDAFIENSSEDCSLLKVFSEKLLDLGDESLKKNDFRVFLNQYVKPSTNEAKRFRRNLMEDHKIRLSFPKRAESMDTLFDSHLNIKYFNDSYGSAYYFVGERRADIQSSFKNACHLRKVVAVEGSKLILDEILQTMNVDFVKTGQSTVIPFPFKYIREYAEQQKSENDRSAELMNESKK